MLLDVSIENTANPNLAQLTKTLQRYNILLVVTKKQVKNINFRVKVGRVWVSAPKFATEQMLGCAISKRLDWIVGTHQKLLQRQQKVLLWGESFHPKSWLASKRDDIHKRTYQRISKLSQDEQIAWIYRYEVARQLPCLLDKWQVVIGRFASSICIRQMSSRWGSCNPYTAKIAINTRLAAYPIGCLEYVLVHELCHLHHANHSPAFWACVKKAMPEYQSWHRLLRHY